MLFFFLRRKATHPEISTFFLPRPGASCPRPGNSLGGPFAALPPVSVCNKSLCDLAFPHLLGTLLFGGGLARTPSCSCQGKQNPLLGFGPSIQGTIQSSAACTCARPAKWKLCVQLGQRNIDAFGTLAVWQAGGIGKRKAGRPRATMHGAISRSGVGGTGTGRCRAYVFDQLPAPATSTYVTRL